MQLQLVEPWLQFSTPIVRQLGFAIASHNIVRQIPQELVLENHFELHPDQLWQQHFLDYLPKLKQLDTQPQPLLDFVAKLKSTRLGLRFEMLIWFWLLDAAYHPYQLLGYSIQMIDGPRTLGELDFLILNRDLKRIEHWEIAVKYYLAEYDYSLQHWYGLNRSDRLARKLQHFTQKQFQFQHALQHDIEARFCMLKGQLYLPEHTAYPLPAWVNPTRRLGQWGHHIPAAQLDYYRLQRHEWICANATPSSATALWWTDGLYKMRNTEQYYMYRQAPYLSRSIV
ncbi:DUF1853 family protein [Acinetobacter sp. B51(2017)]|uniref:DUF1853 family protein n=1 Tax=Acinetobacter sp. B51(2017) TaxID=2060938 RepID=UPI000F0892E0|nr:DUF1853 family protein [Acinetobacter sp. B51(2017)]